MRKSVVLLFSLITLVLFTATIPAQAGDKKESAKKESAEVTVRGWVEAWDVDDEGYVQSVVIRGDQEDTLIAAGGQGSELINYLDEEVKVTGKIEKDSSGNRVMKVISFKVISPSSGEGN